MQNESTRCRRLFLLCHGQCKKNGGILNDFNLPLSSNGVQATLSCCEKLCETTEFTPDCIFCSTALRTRQTAELARGFFPKADLFFRETLYLAPDYRLIDLILQTDSIFQCVMVIGHNPGLENAARYLTGPTKRFKIGQAQGILLTLDKEIDWHGLCAGSAWESFLLKP